MAIAHIIRLLEHGVDGVVNLVGFQCMIHSIIAGVLKPIYDEYENIPNLTLCFDFQEKVHLSKENTQIDLHEKELIYKMFTFTLVLFSILLSLLFIHEMDAIRNAEWKMFAVLKDMDNDKACQVFTLLHLPLYAALLFVMLSRYQTIAFYVVDLFLIVHTILHFLFEKHNENGLKNFLSRSIIYSMGVFAGIHIIIFRICQ